MIRHSPKPILALGHATSRLLPTESLAMYSTKWDTRSFFFPTTTEFYILSKPSRQFQKASRNSVKQRKLQCIPRENFSTPPTAATTASRFLPSTKTKEL